MLKLACVLALAVACAVASPRFNENTAAANSKNNNNSGRISHDRKYTYHGSYNDNGNNRCDHDGFYYRNHDSFVICSNNNAYVQPCAPGSRNSDASRYQYGNDYYQRDFCDVNLVDHGYGVNG